MEEGVSAIKGPKVMGEGFGLFSKPKVTSFMDGPNEIIISLLSFKL